MEEVCSVLCSKISSRFPPVGSVIESELFSCFGRGMISLAVGTLSTLPKVLVVLTSNFHFSPPPLSLSLSLFLSSICLQLSERAVRDYNRGRAYLTNMARKKQISLYTNSVDAALCAVYLVRGFDIPSESPDGIPLQGTSV